MLLAPPCADGARRTGARPHRRLRLAMLLPRNTRGRALALVTVSLLVLLGGTLAVTADVTAAAAPGGLPFAAQPPPPPIPTVAPGCPPGSPSPICSLPTAPPHPTPTPTGLPLPIPTSLPPCVTDSSIPQVGCAPAPTTPAEPPCTGEGCIPQPTSAPPQTNPGANQPGQGGEVREECGITAIGGCVTNAINDFFAGIVTAALNPLSDLLSKTLLTTPTPESMPRIGELWNNSWQILLACYAMLVLIAGVLLMGYETLQTRHGVKEIAPRIVVGFLAGALSLWVASKAIAIANALSQAVMGDGIDAHSAGETVKNLVLGSLNGGMFVIVIGLFLAGLITALLVTYVVRVAMTVILIAGAPIALMCHALPHTEGIAKWWWKAFGGCLAIQVGQSLTLITAMKVFFAPGGFTLFGPTTGGLVNLLVALALMYILFKIPFWILSSVRGGGGRSLLGRLVGAFVAYKTFGLLRGGGGKSRPSGGNSGGGRTVDPYSTTGATAGGQYMLPLKGLKRGKPQPPPHVKHAPKQKRWSPPTPSAPRRTQLALPLGDDWPENKPVLGRDGQYRLPLDVHRSTPTPPPTQPEAGRPRGRSGGQQLRFEFDPYKGNRPTRSGQYPLPLHARRAPRLESSPPAPAPPRPRARDTQLPLPFDPYKGNRATRSGQYPLPLGGMRRVAPTPPTSNPTPPPPASPAPAARPAPRAGGQLRLPLDLPKPTHSTPPKPPKSGGTP